MRIKVKGSIIPNNSKWIYDWLEMDATSPKDIENALNEANGEDITVEINSGGGDVFSGSEIFTALKSYTGNVIVEIVGLAASAASVIAMGGKKVLMSPTAQLMIHNSATNIGGDKNDMTSMAETLKSIDESIANSYIGKTKKTKEELLELMNKETWFNAETALKHGFIDEIMFTSPTYSNDVGFLLPDSAINSLQNERLKMRHLQIENEKLKFELLEKGVKYES